MSQRPCLKTMNDQQTYYETMYILRPDIAEDEVTNHIDKSVSYTHLTLPTIDPV